MTESDWLDTNARYLTAAVAWVRALLDERAPSEAIVIAPDARGLTRFRLRKEQPLLTSSADSNSAAAAMAEAAEATSPGPALLWLAQRLGLNQFEQHVLLLCVAVELGTTIAAKCARAMRDPGARFPTFALALALFDDPAWDALSQGDVPRVRQKSRLRQGSGGGGPLMSIGGYARTPGNTIYFPKGTTKDKDTPALRGWYCPFLIHEMTHTWQTQHGVSTLTKIRTALGGKPAYNYDGPDGLRKAAAAGAHFIDFNTEQQASICGDYASAWINGGDTSPFEPFIAEVKNNGMPVAEKPQMQDAPGSTLPAGQAYA